MHYRDTCFRGSSFDNRKSIGAFELFRSITQGLRKDFTKMEIYFREGNAKRTKKQKFGSKAVFFFFFQVCLTSDISMRLFKRFFNMVSSGIFRQSFGWHDGFNASFNNKSSSKWRLRKPIKESSWFGYFALTCFAYSSTSRFQLNFWFWGFKGPAMALFASPLFYAFSLHLFAKYTDWQAGSECEKPFTRSYWPDFNFNYCFAILFWKAII